MLPRLLIAVGAGLATWLDAVQLRMFGLAWPAAVALALAVMLPALLVFRRPLLSWQLMAAALFGSVLVFGVGVGPGYNEVSWPWPVFGMLAFAVVLFRVAATTDRATAVTVGVLTVLADLLTAHHFAGTPLSTLGMLTFATVGMLAWGDSVRTRQAAQRALAEARERHRADQQRRAVLEERARIARELHDVVAHHISMIAIQAEAAPYRIDGLPEPARETFGEIRTASREALTELRRVLGLLRADDVPASHAPQPDLTGLPELVAGAERAGITARLRVLGTPFRPPSGVALSAYRVVQEALSNAARHAPGSTVDVSVRFRPDRLEVAVTDTGPTGAPAGELGAGLGLVGMRERVSALGGRLTAGPRPDGGFRVTAELPVAEPRSGGSE